MSPKPVRPIVAGAWRGGTLLIRQTLTGAACVAVFGSAALGAEPTLAVHVDEAPFGHFGRSVTARFRVEAPPPVVFGVLTDYAHMAEFMAMVDETRVLEARPMGAVVSFRVRSMNLFDIVEVDERRYEGQRRITWHAIQGPLKTSDGSWSLAPDGRGTAVVYQTDVEPGLPLPSWLTGMLVKQGLPDFLDSVRHRAESGGTWRKP